MKKLILCVSLIVISLVLGSCKITQEVLWGSNIQRIDKDEILQDLLVNQDGARLILVGSKYDYFINDEEQKIKKISTWSGKEKLQSSFSLDASNSKVEVGISFIVPNSILTPEQQKFLRSFRDSKFEKKYDEKFGNNGKMLSIRVGLIGTRTKIESSQNDSKKYDGFVSTRLIKKDYKTDIIERRTSSQTFGKILLTPFAVAADIVLSPVYFVSIIWVSVAARHDGHISDAKK